MTLLKQGRVGYVFAYSFALTDKLGDAAEIERWHRQRAHIEEKIKEAKNGCGLIHLPMREAAANQAWQAAVVFAHNLVSMLAIPGLLAALPRPFSPQSEGPPVRTGCASPRPRPYSRFEV